MSFFQTLGNTFIAAGDYNAKHPFWGSRLSNPKGKELYKAVMNRSNKLNVLSPTDPTHWPSDPKKKPDIIDFGVIKNVPRTLVTTSTCVDLSSDHTPILIYLDYEQKNQQPPLFLQPEQTR